jgi:hypothetical protein
MQGTECKWRVAAKTENGSGGGIFRGLPNLDQRCPLTRLLVPWRVLKPVAFSLTATGAAVASAVACVSTWRLRLTRWLQGRAVKARRQAEEAILVLLQHFSGALEACSDL